MRTRTLFTAIICVAALAALPADAGAQGFLKKIKQKAEKTIGIVTGTETPAEETASDTGADEADAVKPTATDRLPKLRQSSVVWDGEVTPSRAADVRALMNELPALPTADEIANRMKSSTTVQETMELFPQVCLEIWLDEIEK